MGSELDDFLVDLQARIAEDARKVFGAEVVRRWLESPHVGVIEDSDAHARVTGPCGDTMEIYLSVREGIVEDARFMTDGCAASVACGSMACELAMGRTVSLLGTVTQEAILEALGGLPEAHRHCGLLAAETLAEAVCSRTGSRTGSLDLRTRPWASG